MNQPSIPETSSNVMSGIHGFLALYRTVVFFRGVLQSGLAGNPSEEAGDARVGELAEAEMDLLLQSGKAGGVLGELVSPELLLLLKLKVNVLKSLPSRRNGLARL